MQEISRTFHSIWTITKQEFVLFFGSPLVYLIGAVWLVIAGGFFVFDLNYFNQGFAEPSMINTLVVMVFLLLFFAPALTMRLISEELRQGTHELLFTAPVRDWEIVVGKWLAVWAVLTVFMLPTLIYPAILFWRADPESGQILTGYLGLWLASGAMLAIGVFASSLTEYQLAAFFIGVGLMLFLYLADTVSGLVTNTTARNVLSDLTLRVHYENMIQRGLIDPVDVAYFIATILISLFLASQVLGTRRWRA
ncbi:MAG: ABC transporter permease subunit [Anaerolineae bacterium]|nr:ABC transporter permease subunit [Anaerolineae bacterium]